jgi:diaminohydroxyphosphoribosylaminopyrimidine deaminase / 5-amino-6-(5-phosphoribosylamino)uracil reductase
MARCLQLAQLGAGKTAPNPMVGSVLVQNGRIIGEGYHREYGGPHAEVNCINSVLPGNQELISSSTLYVSLEPCAHFGKTPPCSDLIIEKKIPKVVIACRDPFEAVNGKGIEKLQQANIEVITGVLEQEAKQLNRRFFTFHTKNRPYIILKWAQTADLKIAGIGPERLLISNEYSNRKVHQWRSEEAAILIGANTAIKDNPSLNNRLWSGKSPTKILIDPSLRVPATSNLFQEGRTVIFNGMKKGKTDMVEWQQVEKNQPVLPQLLKTSKALNLQSILVEGGATLLQSLIDADLWDEARIITNTELIVGPGLSAPNFLRPVKISETEKIEKDLIQTIYNDQPSTL